MCERLIELKPAINLFFEENETSLSKIEKNEWNLIDGLIDVLQPVEAATRMLSGDKYSTLSLVIPLITSTIVSLKQLKLKDGKDQRLKTMKDSLISNLNSRFKFIETNEYYTTSTILDPSK